MGKIISIRIKDSNARKEIEYKNEVNLMDFNLLALIFEDLINFYNAPIEKAIKVYKNKSEEKNIFPI